MKLKLFIQIIIKNDWRIQIIHIELGIRNKAHSVPDKGC